MSDRWQIPQSWKWVESHEIAEIVGGGTPRTDDPTNFDGGDIPWITPADLSGYKHKYISRGARNITRKGLNTSGARLMPKGTVLFSSRAPIGYVAIAANPVSTNQGFKSFILYLIKPEYAYYYLQRAKDLAVELSSGTTFREISGAKAALIPFPVAPIAEQERIIAEIEKQFTRLDAAAAALRRVQANLKRYRAGVLNAACKGRLVPTEAEIARSEGRTYEPASVLLEHILTERRSRWEMAQLKKIRTSVGRTEGTKWKSTYREPLAPDNTRLLQPLPEGWVWTRVVQLGEVQLGRQRSPKNRSNLYPTKYIRAANIKESGLDLFNLFEMEFEPRERDRYRLIEGDVVLSEASGSPHQVGKPAIWTGELPLCCFQNTVIRLRPTLVSSRYVLIVFKHFYASGVFAAIASGVGINHLGAEKFSSMNFPLAPSSEQLRIVAEGDRRTSVIEETEVQVGKDLKRAERLRQTILKRAFEGKLVPQDPNDEPADQLLDRIRAQRRSAEYPLLAPEGLNVKQEQHMASSEATSKRSLLEILRASRKPLPPEELFSKAGYEQETIDDFYAALKKEIQSGRIREIRHDNKTVRIQAVNQ